jgi:hypothetical protein
MAQTLFRQKKYPFVVATFYRKAGSVMEKYHRADFQNLLSELEITETQLNTLVRGDVTTDDDFNLAKRRLEEEHRSADEERRCSACAHVYIGKNWKDKNKAALGFLFGDLTMEVIGFSPRARRSPSDITSADAGQQYPGNPLSSGSVSNRSSRGDFPRLRRFSPIPAIKNAPRMPHTRVA